MFSIALVAFLSIDPIDETHFKKQFSIKKSTVKLMIRGAVEKPGFYELDKNGTLLEAALQASPLPGADLTSDLLAQPIGRKRKLDVPFMKHKSSRGSHQKKSHI